MHSARRRNNGATRFALVLVVALVLPFAFGAGQGQKAYEKGSATFACQDKTVKVVPIDGTDPKAVYLCPGNTLTWDENSHTFTVIFIKNSPFVDKKKLFHNKDYKSKAMNHDKVLTVYNYHIIVDGELINDPQVVGGGDDNRPGR
jgi:hypothetical protein